MKSEESIERIAALYQALMLYESVNQKVYDKIKIDHETEQMHVILVSPVYFPSVAIIAEAFNCIIEPINKTQCVIY